ncbi:MAG: 6-phosphogluconolactonase [Gammaproteobacteria bacterium]|nr:6-phosphogluconolactonase [Gammaproteobacteria bacterium]
MQTRDFLLHDQRILVVPDMTALSQVVTQRIVTLAAAAIARHGAFHIALSGGSTPRHIHQTLSAAENRQHVQWDKVHIYFGDERNVPHDHPDSNYRMAMETLLMHVPVPPSQIHPIPTGCDDMQACADRYADELSYLPQRDGRPCFDLILLGMGEDGHTASLFPHTDILAEQKRNVAAVFVPRLNTWRVSLTYPVIDRADAVMILVSGAAKAKVLFEVFHEPAHAYPIQGLRNKHVEWCVDIAAAERIIENDVGIGG